MGGLDGSLHFGCNFRRIGRAGAEHDLVTRSHVFDGTREVDDALLPRDAPDEEHEWPGGIDPVFLQRRGRLDALVFLEVDAVVDDFYALFRNVEKAEHIGLGLARDRDDSVGHFDRHPLDPRRKLVSAAELLPLPWAQRLERMHGEHEWDPVIQLRHDAGEMGVPRVTMDDVGIDVRGVEIGAAPDRAEDRSKVLRAGPAGLVQLEAAHFQAA